MEPINNSTVDWSKSTKEDFEAAYKLLDEQNERDRKLFEKFTDNDLLSMASAIEREQFRRQVNSPGIDWMSMVKVD
jgi:hypothetical protein